MEKKICFMVASLSGGGAEGVCVNLANLLTERGWDVEIIYFREADPVYIKRVNSKVRLVALGVKHVRNSLFPLSKYIIKSKPQLIMAFNYEIAVLLVVLRGLLRSHFKIVARNISNFSSITNAVNGKWARITSNVIKLLYGNVDLVVNQCAAMNEDLLLSFPSLRHRSVCINNPVRRDFQLPSRAVVKEDYILCVGRLEEVKAFHHAIEALVKAKRYYPGLKLKIAGKGSLESSLKRLATELGVIDSVEFLGFAKDLKRLYLAAHATVLTSLYEGFPNVLVESIALGTPVIAFDCKSGPAEIIINGVNGYLIPNNDVDALSEGIIQLIKRPLPPEGVANTAKRYHPDAISAKYDEAFLSLV